LSDWSELRLCPECGAANPARGKLCVRCGVNLQEALAEDQALRDERRRAVERRLRSAGGRWVLSIGGCAYPIEPVLLTACHSEEAGEHFLTVDLFADTKDLAQAGFALNCLSFRGLKTLAQLQGTQFSLTEDSGDEINELLESAICMPGQVLQIESLHLKFGRLARGRMRVTMRAICQKDQKSGIAVRGSFAAVVEE